MSFLQRKVAGSEQIVNWKIDEQFTLKNATIYGGYNLYSDMVARSGLDHLLEESFSGSKAPWARYNLPTVLRILMDVLLTAHMDPLRDRLNGATLG